MIFVFFEKRKERKALRPLRNTDKGMKIIALFAVNKRLGMFCHYNQISSRQNIFNKTRFINLKSKIKLYICSFNKNKDYGL
jgi:hypothetical protein